MIPEKIALLRIREGCRMKRFAIPLIVVAVLLWGAFHALGAYNFNANPLRAVVVMVCVLGYLGIWGLLLAVRKARMNSHSSGGKLPPGSDSADH